MTQEHPQPADPEKARQYERMQHTLFAVKIIAGAALLAAYQLSGMSETLAAGLRLRFGAWPVVNGAYILISVFGMAAILFPLSYYGDFVLEHQFGMSRQRFSSWMTDYLKSLAIDLVFALVFFEILYALLRWTPELWWVWATAVYVAFSVVLTAVAPALILPLFYKYEPLDRPELNRKIEAMMAAEGLDVIGVYTWGLAEKTRAANAALAGLGRSRRIILGDTLLEHYDEDEILAILAHELGHYRGRDTTRLIAAGTVLAAAGFYLADLALSYLLEQLAIGAVYDIAGLPVLLFCLLLFSVVSMPLSNAYSRKREFAADAFAARRTENGEALARALDKLADQNLADREPPRWIEFLLHSHPSIGRRIAAIRPPDARN
ncbi:M48 family metalloprotease [Kiritimatiella glycovorans]|uniref:Putative protease HtpX n=1 Tax=Kiritimatiella glycovorans TaxID=1307763 RepID=A0A0G3EE81_9BACT|nr:M48 family metalloprotease [Kiritimatiella glycovorans]AKJ64766.1 putative protease HtpX [Kiritimatiella glycovorans]